MTSCTLQSTAAWIHTWLEFYDSLFTCNFFGRYVIFCKNMIDVEKRRKQTIVHKMWYKVDVLCSMMTPRKPYLQSRSLPKITLMKRCWGSCCGHKNKPHKPKATIGCCVWPNYTNQNQYNELDEDVNLKRLYTLYSAGDLGSHRKFWNPTKNGE